MSIEKKIQERSHSGAKLRITKEDSEYFVIKTITSAIEKNKASILKQQNFDSLFTSTYNIIAIPIVDTNYDATSVSVKMPYCEGLTGEQVAYKGSKIVANNLKTALNFYLIYGLSISDETVYPYKEIHKKIDEIESKLNSSCHLSANIFEKIKLFKEYSSHDLTLPISKCHGDLTLSNIKITDKNQIALFDFLECEINSPLQDAAKLVQDFVYGWSFRKEKQSVRLKGELFCEKAYPSFIDVLYKIYSYEMRVIEVLTLLRIAPYIKSEDRVTIDWFNKVFDKSIYKLKG